MPKEINNETIKCTPNNLSEMPITRDMGKTGDTKENKSQPISFYDLPIELQVRISQNKINEMDGVMNNY